MNSPVKLSIIIPVYNEQLYIEKCVESILSQNYDDYEIIIVDNNSVDDTYQICMNLKAKNSLIRLFQTEKKGVSYARNLGLDNACGQYIMFVDGDDLLMENSIDILMKSLEKNKSSIIQGRILHDSDINNNDCKKEIRVQNSKYMQKIALNPIRYKDEWISETVHGVWGKIYSKAVIGDIRFSTELVLGEDLFFYLQVLNNVNNVTIISDYVYLINSYNEKSSTRRINNEMPKAPAIFREKIEDFYSKNECDREFYENMNYQIFRHIEVGIVYQFKMLFFEYSGFERRLFLKKYLRGKNYSKYFKAGINYSVKKNIRSIMFDYLPLKMLQKEFFGMYCNYYGIKMGVRKLLKVHRLR